MIGNPITRCPVEKRRDYQRVAVIRRSALLIYIFERIDWEYGNKSAAAPFSPPCILIYGIVVLTEFSGTLRNNPAARHPWQA